MTHETTSPDIPADNEFESARERYYPLGFPVSRQAWQRYELRHLIPAERSQGIRDDVAFVRRLAYGMYQARSPEEAMLPEVRPGHLLAFGLLTDILRYVFNEYCIDQNPGSLDQVEDALIKRFKHSRHEKTLETFTNFFPPQTVELENEICSDFLGRRTESTRSGISMANRHRVLREMSLLYISMSNPALLPFQPLFDDQELEKQVQYKAVVHQMDACFEQQPPVKPLMTSLFRTLRAPIEESPDSIEGQLEYIRSKWRHILPGWILQQLMSVRDTLREETMVRGFGKDVTDVLEFGPGTRGDHGYPEPERFTVDKDWMSTVVLIAKVAYVWLFQLSQKYGRDIRHLDEIPDAELDRLAGYGFTGLWLIGLWERSISSEWIKKRMGNPEAAASAYSLYDYTIANDLGGEDAFLRLKERAARREIRLASDMVPNHVGIYSRWIIEHPDWFIQERQSPFPGYQYNGPDLCPDDRVSIYIEDGYWNKTDAAVVFKRLDNWTGDERYIYHGNDGTSMPWNDTAQLDYLNPEVREAVIQTILHVARLSPIIRFDAAMTLAKKHYQRLWFPLPGEGGAIPSRSLHSMTWHDFDAAIPNEFWREVVDRIQTEAPDTLLLAEAFWLMEGYFVRSLGMHRVYNSAFMNMLKLEENIKYRMTVKNVLEFSPEVLKRFVNFMNNPDEDTAVEQFGKGDKYFGVTVMMITMPGLPMFGHGQIEGYTEKYGMEYRRSYWDEAEDHDLINRHAHEIFPLMHMRSIFSGVEHFAFYDFIHPDGYVDENVFVYTNRSGPEKVFVLYNNSYNRTCGCVYSSTAINRGTADNKNLVHVTLGEALGLTSRPDMYCLYRDHRTGLQYIRSCERLCREGFHIQIDGYQYYVFYDFEELRDDEHIWSRTEAHLNGSGHPDVRRLARELRYAPLLQAFEFLVDQDAVSTLISVRTKPKQKQTLRRHLQKALTAFLEVLVEHSHIDIDQDTIWNGIQTDLDMLVSFEKKLRALDRSEELLNQVLDVVPEKMENTLLFWRLPLTWAILRRLEPVLADDPSNHNTEWVEKWLLTVPIVRSFTTMGREHDRAIEDGHLIMLMTQHTPALLRVFEDESSAFFEEFLEDPIARHYLYLNEHNGVIYINKEQLIYVSGWFLFSTVVDILEENDLKPKQKTTLITSRLKIIEGILSAADAAGYRVGGILNALSDTQ